MNRIGMVLGSGLIGIALIAGCADESGETDDGLLDGTTTSPAATTDTGTDSSPTTTASTPMATSTADSDSGSGAATGTPEGSDSPSGDADEEITINEDGEFEQDGTVWDMEEDELEISVGDTVEFTNEGDTAVTLSTEDGEIDEEIEADDSYEHTFDEAGEYELMLDDDTERTIKVVVS